MRRTPGKKWCVRQNTLIGEWCYGRQPVYYNHATKPSQEREGFKQASYKINKRQKEELENPSLDPDDFDKTVEEKSDSIEQLELLDNGFEKLYEKVREELQTNKEIYKDEILKMQGCIRTLTDRSMENSGTGSQK